MKQAFFITNKAKNSNREMIVKIRCEVVPAPQRLKLLKSLGKFRVSHNTAYTKFHQNPSICFQDIKYLGHDTSVRHTIKVSIKFPVTTKHRRDMTEKLLKAPLSPNKQQI